MLHKGLTGLLGFGKGARLVYDEVLEERVHVGDGGASLNALMQFHGALAVTVLTYAQLSIDCAQECLGPVVDSCVRVGGAQLRTTELALHMRLHGAGVQLLVCREVPRIGGSRGVCRHIVQAAGAEGLACGRDKGERDGRPIGTVCAT